MYELYRSTCFYHWLVMCAVSAPREIHNFSTVFTFVTGNCKKPNLSENNQLTTIKNTSGQNSWWQKVLGLRLEEDVVITNLHCCDFFPRFTVHCVNELLSTTLPHTKGYMLCKGSQCTRATPQVGFNSRYWLDCQWLYRPFFLNLMFSMTKIENLKQQFGGEIIFVIFGKIVTSLIQKLWANILTTNQLVYLIS